MVAAMTDADQIREMYRHVSAAISEGLCPRHGTRLEPVPATDGRIAGQCAIEGYGFWWWLDPVSQEAGWSRGIWMARTGRYLTPEWLA
jgi:hypothetical protein